MAITYIVSESPKAQEVAVIAQQILNKVKTPDRVEVIVAIGGDGTLLHAIKKHFQNPAALFVGISAGSLGLLQAVEVDQIQQLADALANNTHHTITAPLLAATLDDSTQPVGYAFNDISIERAGARAAKFHLAIDGSRGTFIGDGIIFATPLGSTAYSLAAGGPIVDTDVQDVFIATPNNPHISTLYSSLQRPHILHKQRHVAVHIDTQDAGDRPVQLIVDGVVQCEHVTAASVTIYASDHHVSLMQLEPRGLQNRIQNKRLGRL